MILDIKERKKDILVYTPGSAAVFIVAALKRGKERASIDQITLVNINSVLALMLFFSVIYYLTLLWIIFDNRDKIAEYKKKMISIIVYYLFLLLISLFYIKR